jgi:hypothetical protein
MSWFNQKTQLGDGSSAGGPLRRESAVCASVRIDAPAAEAPLQAAQLHFKVRYALPEYVSFMWQHAGFLIRRRRIGRFATWWMLSKSTSAAALNFVLQGRSRHLYDFLIDDHGIVRTSNTGVTLVPWADVSAIRRYSRGYMMVLKRGTLPIPFRCLSGAQSGTMDGFAAALRSATRRIS